jgi:hypothetical protein
MAAEAAEPTVSTTDSLFRPSTRFRDDRRLAEGWAEVELLQDLVLEDVLATGITWENFCLFLRNKVIWLTPDVYTCYGYMDTYVDDPVVLALQPDVIDSPSFSVRVHVRAGTATAAATATCDFLLRILATCEKDL